MYRIIIMAVMANFGYNHQCVVHHIESMFMCNLLRLFLNNIICFLTPFSGRLKGVFVSWYLNSYIDVSTLPQSLFQYVILLIRVM